MAKKEEGLPKEVLEKLDYKKREREKVITTPLIIEKHQVRLTIPSEIRRELDLKGGQVCKVRYDKKNKEIIFKL